MITIPWLQDILNRVGKNSDSAALNTTLFAGQQAIYDDMATPEDIAAAEAAIRGTDGDTLKTLSDQIDTLGGLTAKEKAMMGYGPSFKDYFNRNVLDSAYWTDTVTGTGVVLIENTTYRDPYLVLSNTSGAASAVIETKSKYYVSLHDGSSKHIRVKVYVMHVPTANNYWGVGLAAEAHSTATASSIFTGNSWYAGVRWESSYVGFVNSNGSGRAVSNIGAYAGSNTSYDIEIVLSNGHAKCYIDGTLRADSTTYVDYLSAMRLIAFNYNQSGYYQALRIHSVESWPE